MKNLIIIILLCCIGVTGFGQEYIKTNYDSTEKLIIGKDGYGYVIKSIPVDNYDTISVLMLVSDTAAINYGSFASSKMTYRMNRYEVGGWCFWMKGYKVIREIIYYDEPELVGYLDAEKKPLNKNIVVWQSLNIK